MVTGARTLSLEDTFLEPQVLEPPPTRHALFFLLLALAAMLQLGTANWGDLYDGLEGQIAGGAREMLDTHQWLVPTNDGVPCLQTPPLAYWLITLSYQLFGVSPMAARLPIAGAMIISIAFTFLIGERLAGYWRGFTAGLIHLCFAGTFLLARGVTPEPISSAVIGGAIFCLVCGYQRRQFRYAWFAGFWLCLSFACLTTGPIAFFQLAGICLLAAIFFREARLRFRPLLHWGHLLSFLGIISPWYIWTDLHFPGSFLRTFVPPLPLGLPLWQFVIFQFVWLFPASILILPGLLFASRKIIRPKEITFADALPILWVVVGFISLLRPGYHSAYSSIGLWSGFALWSALIWERTPRTLRVAGLGSLVLIAAIFGVGIIEVGDSLRPLLSITAATIALFALPALYSAVRQRPEMALLLVLVGMVPVGLCLTEGASRIAPSFSLANAARFLNLHPKDTSQIFFEGRIYQASSLTFYLNQKFFLVSPAPDLYRGSGTQLEQYVTEDFVLEGWNSSNPIYLIIPQWRLPQWRESILSRAHIFHQVTSCGYYVVLSNQV